LLGDKPGNGSGTCIIFEKAEWDLLQFMKADKGMNMSINERLSMCADIGSAIMALHSYG
jgi:hypothetical protein